MVDPMSTATVIAADIDAARAAARRRHALWDKTAFDALCAEAAPALGALDPVSRQAWLRLASEPSPSRTLRRCLARAEALLLPIDAAARPQALVDLFNLCDGMLAGEAWFDPFIASRLDGLSDLTDLPTLIELALDDVHSAAPSAWGAVQRFTLDPRPIDPLFVPGHFSLVAPRVLCVADRRRDTCLGLAFGRDLVTLFGPVPALEPIVPPEPRVTVGEYRAQFGEETLYLGDLYPTHAHFVLGSALVAAAVDSQRVWVMRPEQP